MIRGENLPFEDGPMGFYTARWVQAVNPKRAELKAVDSIKKEILKYLDVEALKKANARMYLEEIEQVEKLPLNRGGGFSFFPADDEGSARAAFELEQDTT